MIEITEKEIFGKVVADALCKLELNTSLDTGMKLRWVNAIAKAVIKIEKDGVFMDWQDNDTLLIWSQGSNNIYQANGACQCAAYLRGLPCWHKAAKQLLKNYFSVLETGPEARGLEPHEIPYLQNSNNEKPEIVGGCRI